MARTDVRDKSEQLTSSPSRPDPALDALPPVENLTAVLKRVEEALAKLADVERGQPNHARPQPGADGDASVRVLGVDDVAKLLGLSRSLAYDAVAKGQIPSVKIGGRRLVPYVALVRMLEQAAHTQVAEAAE